MRRTVLGAVILVLAILPGLPAGAGDGCGDACGCACADGCGCGDAAGPEEDARDGAVSAEEVARTIARNERVAVAGLRQVIVAQAHFQATGLADGNRDGVGEYGTFAELSGAIPVRGSERKVRPPVLPDAFAKIEDGSVRASGYRFRIFLPGKKGPVGEAGAGGCADVEARQAETLWCCYAWPEKRGRTGRRTFFVNQAGDMLAADAAYGGDTAPAALAAFLPKQTSLAGKVAVGKAGQDQNRWTVVR